MIVFGTLELVSGWISVPPDFQWFLSLKTEKKGTVIVAAMAKVTPDGLIRNSLTTLRNSWTWSWKYIEFYFIRNSKQ